MNHGCCERCEHKLCAKRVPIFQELSTMELEKVADLIVHRSYQKGEIILMEDQMLDSLMIINQGGVKAFRYTGDGKEQILYVFTEGDFFGEKNLLKKQAITYNVEALKETNLCMIPNQSFSRLLIELPDISMKIIDQLCNRIDHLENAIQNMGSKNVESRVSSVLLEFALKYGEEQEEGTLVTLPLSREGIANYIGVTRETVSRKMSNLQEEGIIELIGNKKVLILDKEALELTE